MNFVFEIEKFNAFLNGLCTTANALRTSHTGPEFDCYIEQLNVCKNKSFEDNFKDFFIENAKQLNIETIKNVRCESKWIFKMNEAEKSTDAINQFFYSNLFSGLNEMQYMFIASTLLKKIEALTGVVIQVKHGFIIPPQLLNPYSQHWQHLYIQGNHTQLLITFEANT